MKRFLSMSGSVALTLCLVVAAVFLGWRMWDYYMNEPWTRDGKVRADVVQVAADVSGFVSDVDAHDNQTVKAGDVIFSIDRARFDLALRQAEAQVAAAKAALDQSTTDLDRYEKLSDQSVTRQKIDEATAAVAVNSASLDQARVAVDTAKLNLQRSIVKAPVNGVLTNFSLRPGNYVGAGAPVTALIDSDSYYVSGYFEENKLDRIKQGDRAVVTLMGTKTKLQGTVAGLAGGIEDRERTDAAGALANVNPTFTWVRLAQRVPVRIELIDVPANVALVAGRTASVEIVGSEYKEEPLLNLFSRE